MKEEILVEFEFLKKLVGDKKPMPKEKAIKKVKELVQAIAKGTRIKLGSSSSKKENDKFVLDYDIKIAGENLILRSSYVYETDQVSVSIWRQNHLTVEVVLVTGEISDFFTLKWHAIDRLLNWMRGVI